MKEKRVLAGIAALMLGMTGCGGAVQDVPQKIVIGEVDSGEYGGEEKEDSDAERIAALCRDVYETAAKAGTLGNPEVVEKIVGIMGANGYAAVDEENQTDMTEPEQVIGFCETVNAKEEGELTIVVVTYSGGFIKYDFHTANGEVEVVRSYYRYQDGYLESMSRVRYRADSWQYTEEGYLLFEGSYYSEDFYVLLSDEASEHVALRVEPLDKECRELNRRYILPVGYRENNLFLVNWSEGDFGDLDFYDLFDRLYPLVYEEPVPYKAAEAISEGAVYRIPPDVFEHVIGKYIRIDKETLRRRTGYLPEDAVYEYRPRGFYEMEYSDIPRPEVESWRENSDGTITLMVNAVYPEENTARAYTHETVVRPLADGRFQYVSNRILFPEGGYEAWWHCERLAEEEWEEQYLSGEADCLLNEAEKEELENTAFKAAAQLEEGYGDGEMKGSMPFSDTGGEVSREQRGRAVSLLGKAGYVSVTDGVNMENADAVRDFYEAYQKGQDAMVTVFDVNRDGAVGVHTFIHRDGHLQTFYIRLGWQSGGTAKIQSTEVSDIAEIKLTEKGYFIYTYEVQVYHAGLRQYWRIAPLSDRYRELTEKYISGLSYVNYNVLVTDWDSGNAEDILMPCMFEDIYRMDTGENIKSRDGEIPAELYEKIMTTYFPVTKEQVRKACGYHASTDSYSYEMILSHAYPPFGEVVNYAENPDGTLTLFVDGVWPDYNCDCAFTNTITLQPFADGTFRYLSNSIEKKEMDIPLSGIGD